MKFRQTEGYNAMYRMQYPDGDGITAGSAVNRDTNGVYDGYGMMLAFSWQKATWLLAAMKDNGEFQWYGFIDIPKLYNDYKK
jgi:hypothetical protein